MFKYTNKVGQADEDSDDSAFSQSSKHFFKYLPEQQDVESKWPIWLRRKIQDKV